MVKKFIRGVYNLRTPAPKYSYIWDVSVALEFFKHLPENNLLSLKLLSLKLVMLVALVSGQRVQTLSQLDLSFAYSVYHSIVFVILDMTKTSRPGKSAPQIVLSEYGQDKRLCVISCLVAYLLRTLEYRKSSKLFLDLQKPHKAVGSQTLSRWLKATLRLSGVRIDIFSGHSTRAASSSKAKLAGLSVDSILECVGWSNEQTFARYYNKKIVDINAFANVVLTCFWCKLISEPWGLSIIYNLNIILHIESVRMICWVQYTSFYTKYSDFSLWLTLAALKSRCDFETKYIGEEEFEN